MNERRLEPVYVNFPAEVREWPDPVHVKVWNRSVELATHERTVAALTLIWAAIRFVALAVGYSAVAVVALVVISVRLFPFLVAFAVVAVVVELAVMLLFGLLFGLVGALL